MTLSQAAKDKAARLEQHAKYAIEQYNKDVAKGGEPLFPDWAVDLLALLDARDTMADALVMAQSAIENSAPTMAHYPEPKKRHGDALQVVKAALERAGVVTFDTLTKPQADIWHPSKPEGKQ